MGEVSLWMKCRFCPRSYEQPASSRPASATQFFVCDIFNAAPKADVGSMEHPIFSLSTKPDLRPRHYEHNGLSIDIKPSSDGMATVHDRDILIFCISQLIRALNDGREVSQVARF